MSFRLLISVGEEDKKLIVWDVKTGKIVCSVELPRFLGKVTCCCFGGFAKDVKRRNTARYQFATGGDALCLWCLDPYTGHIDYQPATAGKTVRNYACVAFLTAPDSCGRDGYVDEFLLAGTYSGDFISFLIKPHTESAGRAPVAHFTNTTVVCAGGVLAMCPSISAKETLLFVGGGDGTVAVFRYSVVKSQWIDEEGFTANFSVHGLAISKDGTEVYAGTSGGDMFKARRGYMSSDTSVQRICSNHSGEITAVTFAPDSNNIFATACADGSVRVWCSDEYTVLTEFAVAKKQAEAVIPHCLDFAIDAIVTGWSDGFIRSHNSETGEMLWTIENAHVGGVTALRLSHNLRFILSGGEDGGLRLWELRNRELVVILKQHTKRVTKIILFKDDIHAISCSKDRSFLCWDLQKERRVSAHTQRMGGINAITLNKGTCSVRSLKIFIYFGKLTDFNCVDQTLVVSVGQERSISLWDLRERFPIWSVTSPVEGMHDSEATCIAISHCGGFLATGGLDNKLKVWHEENGTLKLIQTVPAHSGTIHDITFSQDDKQLISVGADGGIFVWNVFGDESPEAAAEEKLGREEKAGSPAVL